MDYLSGPLLGKLFRQVTADASSSAGDQHHLLAQVLPHAWQQRKQTCSDYIIEHLKREQTHTPRAPQIHLDGARAGLCSGVDALCSNSAAPTATSELLQVYPHANSLMCSLGNCCMSNPLAQTDDKKHKCVTSSRSDMIVDMHHAVGLSE